MHTNIIFLCKIANESKKKKIEVLPVTGSDAEQYKIVLMHLHT